jgi:diguanylate cyclase (GGDEF)-like protein/PAS domain S-box-containing protein
MLLSPRNLTYHRQVSLALQGPNSARRPLRVLFVSSHSANVEQCLHELAAASFEVSPDVVSLPEQFVKRVSSKYYDLVLVELPTLDWKGPGTLEILRQKKRQIPLIFLPDSAQPEAIAELINAGAGDCVAMDHIGHLPVAVRRVLRDSALSYQRDQVEKKLRHSEECYRALVGNRSYGMCRCSGGGKFLDVNQALVTMLGYASRGELMAENRASEIFCNASKRAQLMGQTPGADGSTGLEVVWKKNDGTDLKVRISGREVSHEGEEDYEIIVEDVTQQRKLEDHLREEASKDSLTGLVNYRRFVEIVDTEIKRSGRTLREFALLFLDLDGLKKINDHFGHSVGSQALCRLADVLSNCSREMDSAARFGGDEFAVVLPETGELAAGVVARRICNALVHDDRTPQLSVSVGTAIYPKDGETIEALLVAADTALYSRKAATRNSDTSSSTPIGARAPTRVKKRSANR